MVGPICFCAEHVEKPIESRCIIYKFPDIRFFSLNDNYSIFVLFLPFSLKSLAEIVSQIKLIIAIAKIVVEVVLHLKNIID